MCSSPEIIDNELDRIVNDLLDIEIDVLVDEQLQELLVSTYRTATRLAAVRAKLVSAWDGRGVWASNGARTPAVRLGNDCRLSGESAKAELRRARKLRSMPHTLAALADGEISTDRCTCAPCSTRSTGRSSSPNSPAWNDSCTTPNKPPANSSARLGSDEPTPW